MEATMASIRSDGYTKIAGELHVDNVTSVYSQNSQGWINSLSGGWVMKMAWYYDGGADIRGNVTVLRAYLMPPVIKTMVPCFRWNYRGAIQQHRFDKSRDGCGQYT